MSPEKQLQAFIPVLQEFSLLSQSIVVVLHVSPIHLFLGADTIDILLDIGISVTSAILVGIARVVRIQTVGYLPLIGIPSPSVSTYGFTFLYLGNPPTWQMSVMIPNL